MTVGKISAACWIVFVVMSVAFLPVAAGIMAVHAIPHTIRLVLAILAVLVLWWGPFAYAMYLALVVIRRGDPRLLKRGIRGTAEVLSAKATNEVIQEGEFAWEAPRVWKYRLRVSVPGKDAYETSCRICTPAIRQGSTVHVAVSPHNRHRVTIDVGQGSMAGSGSTSVPGLMTSDDVRARLFPAGLVNTTGDARGAGQSHPPSANAERIDELTKLGQLHRQGVLTDEEFASEKARILGGAARLYPEPAASLSCSAPGSGWPCAARAARQAAAARVHRLPVHQQRGLPTGRHPGEVPRQLRDLVKSAGGSWKARLSGPGTGACAFR